MDVIAQISTSGAKFVSNNTTAPKQNPADARGQQIVGEITGGPTGVRKPTPNIWTASANEALAVVDIVKQNGMKVLTSKDPLKDLSKGDFIKNLLKGGLANSTGIFKQVLDVSGGQLNKQQIFDKVIAAMPSIRGAISGMGLDSNTFKDLFKDVKFDTSVFGSIGDSLKGFKLDGFSLPELNGIKDLIKSYTGELPNIKFNDLKLDTGMITNLVSICTKTGMGGSVDQLLKVAKDKGILLDVAKECLGNMSKNPDITLLESLTKAVGDKTLIKLDPDVIRTVCGAFSIEVPKKPEPVNRMVLDPDYKKFLDVHGPYGASDAVLSKSTYDKAISTFDRLDPSWRQVDLGGAVSQVYDFTKIANGSTSIKDIYAPNAKLSTNPEDKKMILATAVAPKSIDDAFKKHFPLTIIEETRISIRDSFVSSSTPFVQ